MGRELTWGRLSRGELSARQRRALAQVRSDAILATEGCYTRAQRHAWLHTLQSTDDAAEASEVVMVTARGVAIAYTELDLATGHMSGLFVTPARHRSGIGTRLFETALRLTTQAGLKTLCLSASPDAAAFYERRGCLRVSHLMLLLGDEPIPCVFLEKPLI